MHKILSLKKVNEPQTSSHSTTKGFLTDCTSQLGKKWHRLVQRKGRAGSRKDKDAGGTMDSLESMTLEEPEEPPGPPGPLLVYAPPDPNAPPTQPQREHMLFPEDILHNIFQLLMPEPDMLKFGECRRLHNEPCQVCDTLTMRKNLVLVCKAWNFLALPYLYRDPVLRRFTQLRQLSRTVIIRPYIFGPLIRRLTCAFYLPGAMTKEIIHQINDLLKYCPKIHHVSFEGFCATGVFDSRMVSMMSHDISVVTYDAPRDVKYLYSTMHSKMKLPLPPATFARLRTACIPLASQDACDYTSDLAFPNLERITWVLSPLETGDRSRRYRYPADKWDMPKVKEMRFRPCFYPGHALNEYLQKMADQLVVLDLGLGVLGSWAGTVQAFKRTPNLRHVVFAIDHEERNRPTEPGPFGDMPDLELMDVIVEDPREESHRLLTAVIPSGVRCVRYFERHVLKWTTDLPHFAPLAYDKFEVGQQIELDCYGYKVWAECHLMEGRGDVREIFVWGVPKPPEKVYEDRYYDRERDMYYGRGKEKYYRDRDMYGPDRDRDMYGRDRDMQRRRQRREYYFDY